MVKYIINITSCGTSYKVDNWPIVGATSTVFVRGGLFVNGVIYAGQHTQLVRIITACITNTVKNAYCVVEGPTIAFYCLIGKWYVVHDGVAYSEHIVGIDENVWRYRIVISGFDDCACYRIGNDKVCTAASELEMNYILHYHHMAK